MSASERTSGAAPRPPSATDLPSPPDDPLARVRLLLRRYIVSHAAWLPGIHDPQLGQALAHYVLTGVALEAPALAVLGEQLGLPPAPPLVPVFERFEELAVILRLDPLETDLCWLVLAPELDANLLAIYRVLWGDRQRRACDEDFLGTVLDPVRPARARAVLDPRRALFRLRLLELRDGGSDARTVRPSRRLLDFLLDEHAAAPEARLPADLDGWVEACAPETPVPGFGSALPIAPAALELLRGDRGRHACILLLASSESGVDLVVRQLLAGGPRGLLVARASSAAAGAGLLDDDAAALRALLREARLRNAAVLLTELATLAEAPPHQLRELVELLAAEPGPVFLHPGPTLPGWVRELAVPRLAPLTVELPPLDAAFRQRLWTHLVPGADTLLVQQLAARPLGPASMLSALAVHQTTRRPLAEVCDTIRPASLASLATLVRPSLSWTQVVLPPKLLERIDEIRTFGRHYRELMSDWGLGRITSGRGIKVLLSGPSGTGKTLVSGLLALDVGAALYRVDLAAIVSKYIGETEQRLSRLFDEATATGAALLFDEADGLFARRTEVKSSTDRYANQGVNYLLQRVEDFDGFIVLTTNLERSIDEAFVRRLHYHLHFEPPDVDARQLLWEVHLPETLPLDGDLDLEWLAEEFELTGGQIRKVVIRAAVYARQRDGRIGQQDLLEAANVEYTEIGKLRVVGAHVDDDA